MFLSPKYDHSWSYFPPGVLQVGRYHYLDQWITRSSGYPGSVDNQDDIDHTSCVEQEQWTTLPRVKNELIHGGATIIAPHSDRQL